jgi:hypothetical protein
MQTIGQIIKNHPVFSFLFLLFAWLWLRYVFLIYDFQSKIQGNVLPYSLAYQEGMGNFMVLLSIFSILLTAASLLCAALNKNKSRFYLVISGLYASPVLILLIAAFVLSRY